MAPESSNKLHRRRNKNRKPFCYSAPQLIFSSLALHASASETAAMVVAIEFGIADIEINPTADQGRLKIAGIQEASWSNSWCHEVEDAFSRCSLCLSPLSKIVLATRSYKDPYESFLVLNSFWLDIKGKRKSCNKVYSFDSAQEILEEKAQTKELATTVFAHLNKFSYQQPFLKTF